MVGLLLSHPSVEMRLLGVELLTEFTKLQVGRALCTTLNKCMFVGGRWWRRRGCVLCMLWRGCARCAPAAKVASSA